MIEEKLRIKNDSRETLVGVEVLPSDKKEKCPAVILVHGFAYYKEEDGVFVDLAKHLADAGIASYRFDFSGCGESEGDFIESSLTKLKDDLKSILEFVKSRETTDTDRLGIVAQSFGTTTTIALAPQIKSLVLMGSFLHGKEVLRDYFGKDYNPTGISEKARSSGGTTKIKPGFWKDFENHDLPSLVKRIHCPILLIHGLDDDIVPIFEMEAIYEIANEPKEKIILEGADHSLEPKREDMYKIVADWFTKTL